MISKSLRHLLVACILFTSACAALAGSERWWALYTPDEMKQVIVEYDKTLYTAPKGTDQEGRSKFAKAIKTVQHAARSRRPNREGVC